MSATEATAEQLARSPQVDPTGTTTLRGSLAGKWRGAYGRINAKLREDVVTRDVFGTRLDNEQLAETPSDPPGANYDPAALPALADAPTSEQVRRFRDWFDRQQERAIRGRLSRRNNPWLVQAYAAGVRRAEQSLREADYIVESTDPTDVPRRETTLDEARGRFDDRLTKAFQDTTAETGQTLQEGLAQDLAATVLFKRLRERVNHSRAGKTRARPVAHGSIVRTANEAGLDRYQQAGVEEVTAQVEARIDGPTEGTPPGADPEDADPDEDPRGTWVTAGDARVCPQCRTLAGQSWRISDIRAGRAPMPVRDTHPSCRCQIIVA